MPFGVDLKKFKLDEKSGAAKFVNPAIDKLDELLSKLEKPKSAEAPQTPAPTEPKTEAASEVKPEEEKK